MQRIGLRSAIATIAFLTLVGGCKSSEPPKKATPSAASTVATRFFLTANQTAFDITTFSAPAQTPFQVVFKNNDEGVPHSFSLYEDEGFSKEKFEGKRIEGVSKTTYRIPALERGSFSYRCEIHPDQMKGTLVVQ